MKKTILIASIALLAACSNTPSTGSFGTKFEANKAMAFTEAEAIYSKGKDTTYVIEGQIDQVCQHGQCWMNLKSDSSVLRVDTKEKFKLPKDAKGKHAVASGHFETTPDGLEFITTGVEIK